VRFSPSGPVKANRGVRACVPAAGKVLEGDDQRTLSPLYYDDYRLCLLVHKTLGQTPTYDADLLTLIANIPARSSLRASLNGDFVVPLTSRRIGDSIDVINVQIKI